MTLALLCCRHVVVGFLFLRFCFFLLGFELFQVPGRFQSLLLRLLDGIEYPLAVVCVVDFVVCTVLDR